MPVIKINIKKISFFEKKNRCKNKYFDNGNAICERCSFNCENCVNTATNCSKCTLNANRDNKIQESNSCPCTDGFFEIAD